MHRGILVYLAAGLLAATAASGCLTTDDEGAVMFFVKDAPADEFTEVWLNFSLVEVHRAGPGNGTDGNDTEDGGWIAIVDEAHGIDLKAFAGDARAFLGSEDVAAGTYTQIRIHIDDAYGVLDDGAREDITVPSDAFRLVRPWTVEGGLTTVLTVDFDLNQSLVRQGQGDLRLRPTAQLIVEGPTGEAVDTEAVVRTGTTTSPTQNT